MQEEHTVGTELRGDHMCTKCKLLHGQSTDDLSRQMHVNNSRGSSKRKRGKGIKLTLNWVFKIPRNVKGKPFPVLPLEVWATWLKCGFCNRPFAMCNRTFHRFSELHVTNNCPFHGAHGIKGKDSSGVNHVCVRLGSGRDRINARSTR
jgi:hypothetical protein